VLKGAIVVTKVTPKVNVSRGELVPYTITARNTLNGTLTGINIADRLPAGFQYRVGSARVDNVAMEPVQLGRVLTWPNLNFTAQAVKTIDLLLVVGAGVREGEHVNQAYAINSFVDTVVSDVAEATVRIVPDADFDCTDILGKVFDDRNVNGMQDEGEPGLPAVRLATVNGLLVTTDQHGRYHITCPMIANEARGSNFILKLDVRTLPTGYRMTTGNPETIRLTRGKFATLNFGASIHRVVRVDVNAMAFEGDQPGATYKDRLKQMMTTLAERPSVLRIAYANATDDARLVRQRMDNLIAFIRACWAEDEDRYRLSIEEEIMTIGTPAKGDVK
jgi:large repetitive protein